MLTKMQTEWVLEFLSGSGPLGDMLLRRKTSLDFSSAIVFPKAASRLGLDFQWGLPIEDRFHGGVSEFVCEIKRGLFQGEYYQGRSSGNHGGISAKF